MCQNGPLVATSWLDNKVVDVMSTNSQPGEEGMARRKKKDGTYAEVRCPSAIIAYVKNMRGVDRNDQLRQYYNVRTKSRKFYKYIYWFLLDMAITNAFIIFRVNTKTKPPSLRQFHLQLAKELIGDYNSRKRATMCTSIRPKTSERWD